MRWIIRIIAIVVIFVGVAVAGLLLLPGEKIAKIAADQVKAHTGRDLVFDGKVSVTLWPVLGVETGAVTFGNTDWAGPDPMLTAQGLAIGISAPDLLRGEIRVQRIVAIAPELRLTTHADGRANWEFGAPSKPDDQPTGTGDSSAVPLTLERLNMRDARLIYTAGTQPPVVIENADLSLLWPSATEPADIVITAHPAGQPVTIAANIGGFDGFLAGEIAPISARIKTAGGEVDFLGRASLSGDAAGRVTLHTSDTGQMLRSLGLDAGALPQGVGRVAKIDGDVTYTSDGRLSVRNLAAVLDGNSLTGDVDITLSDVPEITAQFSAGALDFTNLGGGEPATNDTAASGTGWSTDAIDASGLAALNATISLSAQSIKTDVAQLDATQIVLAIDRSRAVLDLTQVSAYGGTLAGQLVANNRSGFSVGGDLRAVGINLKQALGELAGFERLDGRADTQVKFLGSGASLDAIMHSLSGQGALTMGRGVIAGFDLDKLMRSGDGTGGTTVFDSLNATYTIDQGQLINDDLLLLVANFKADGAGRVGLGDQDIDYLFTPVLLRANAGQGLSIPVRIRGPWSDPEIRSDLSEALQSEIDLNVDKAKDQARDKVQSKLEQELDVTVEEGQDSQEVLQDGIEDKAKNELLRLFGPKN